MARMKTLAVSLLFLAAVIVTRAITHYQAFFAFSPHAGSETAGFVALRTMIFSLGYGLLAMFLAAACLLIDYLARRKKRISSGGQETQSKAYIGDVRGAGSANFCR